MVASFQLKVWVAHSSSGGKLIKRSLAYSFLRGPRLPLHAVAGSSFVVWSHATCMAPCKFALRERERERERDHSRTGIENLVV